MKHLHRLIVNSSVYRMSSSTRDRAAEAAKDPDNQRMWRRLPVRLEAEVIRDSMLTLSAEMDWSRGGPSIPPANQAASKRRSLYFYHSNNERNLFLTTFDGPMVRECYRREQSIVPQQALAMINGALSRDSSQKITSLLAGNLSSQGLVSDADFVKAAFEYVTGIRPSAGEIAAGCRAMEAWRRGADAGASGAAREQFVWVLLNHNDFITLR
jgi:hypothetical protein